MGSLTTPDAATDLPPLKGPIFLYLTDLNIESRACEKVVEAMKNKTQKKENLMFIMLNILIVFNDLSKINKSYQINCMSSIVIL